MKLLTLEDNIKTNTNTEVKNITGISSQQKSYNQWSAWDHNLVFKYFNFSYLKYHDHGCLQRTAAGAEMPPDTGLPPRGGLATWVEPCAYAWVHSPESRTNSTN